MSIENRTQGPITIERHPLLPFLVSGARMLFLGSFPPSKERWSMDFFYPNFQNDMWRIMGLVFYADKDYLVKGKGFDYEKVVHFCTCHGIALFDTAVAVRRLKANASDAFLEIVEKTDLNALLDQLPDCRAIISTGGKSATEVASHFGVPVPAVGSSVSVEYAGRNLSFYRMPSSSRAYPMALEKKAAIYQIIKEI